MCQQDGSISNGNLTCSTHRFPAEKFSSQLVLLEHRDGLGVQPVVALAAMLLQHEGGLHVEQLIAAVLDLPSPRLT